MSITCSYTQSGDIQVFGATTKAEARDSAMNFFREDCHDQGLILNEGGFMVWGMDDPQPDNWQDYYIFLVMDAEPLPREYYEY